MKITLRLITLMMLLAMNAATQPLTVTGPAGSGSFGAIATVLTNGNYVIGDPGFDNGTVQNVGAVYLYNGSTHALISTLIGSTAQDKVGSAGITALPNGNFVIGSPLWDNGSVADAGAATWANGTTGLNGVLSSSNSIVGTTANDNVGAAVTVLKNGNYVIASSTWSNGTAANAGAVTWRSGTAATSGTVSSSNSLVGSHSNDYVGGVVPLPNGNYVVVDYRWTNGTAFSAGSATWANGATGISGIITSSNSLVGTSSNDFVSLGGVVVLSNGNYLVGSTSWTNGTILMAGASTWGNGATGITGNVSSSNSLVGGSAFDAVGLGQGLANGNYVVHSTNWDNGTVVDAGAVTWGSGSTGITGTVSASNSLVGSSANDRVGTIVTTLTNGNYVVSTVNWDNGSIVDAGAVTWGSGAAGVVGSISSSNSLVGSTAGDQVGYPITALTNGNYVVGSTTWDNGTIVNAGAATWANGTMPTSGTLSSSNSLVGSHPGDALGSITALSNGNYVVTCPSCDNSTAINAGAATWADGTTGITGTVTMINSLIGGAANDEVGKAGVTALTNGNYIVKSTNWDNGALVNAGAATWGDGTTGITGLVSSANSLVGSTASDSVCSGGVTSLTNGNYVVNSSSWDNVNKVNAGAITWGNGATGANGIISTSNSLAGNQANDDVGKVIVALSNGDYIVSSGNWDNGAATNAGAVTLGDGSAGTRGIVNVCNSATGSVPSSGNTIVYSYDATYGYLITGLPAENKFMIYKPRMQALATSNTSSTQTISGGFPIPFLDTACKLIATIQSAGSNGLSGATTAKVYVQSATPTYAGRAYVRRHYDITPAPGPVVATATAVVTLYFTQTELNDYNNNNGTDPNLPTGPSDAAGIAAFRINMQHGTSASGLPGSYTGWNGVGSANIIIDPADTNIVYNSILSRWEVTFAVTGFGGFFAWGGPGPALGLPGSTNAALISIAPVPATNNISIRSAAYTLNGTAATVTDMQGRTVCRFTLQSRQELNISAWAAGVYSLRLADGSVLRIVKQ